MTTTHKNVITDISTLTKLPTKTLNSLVKCINLSIGNIVAESKAAGEAAVAINIGIGTLSIDLTEMQCKFLPSKDLKTTIKSSLVQPVDPLELELEALLKEKLISFVDEVL